MLHKLNKYQIINIVGYSGAGKDTLGNMIVDRYDNCVILKWATETKSHVASMMNISLKHLEKEKNNIMWGDKTARQILEEYINKVIEIDEVLPFYSCYLETKESISIGKKVILTDSRMTQLEFIKELSNDYKILNVVVSSPMENRTYKFERNSELFFNKLSQTGDVVFVSNDGKNKDSFWKDFLDVLMKIR